MVAIPTISNSVNDIMSSSTNEVGVDTSPLFPITPDVDGWNYGFENNDYNNNMNYLMASPELDSLLLNNYQNQFYNQFMKSGEQDMYHYNLQLLTNDTAVNQTNLVPDWSLPLESFPNLLNPTMNNNTEYNNNEESINNTNENSYYNQLLLQQNQSVLFNNYLTNYNNYNFYNQVNEYYNFEDNDLYQFPSINFDDKSDKKPPYSYPQLITRAILESPKQQLLLSEIYEWMMNRFTFFKLDRTGVWRNSVRHNLSVNKAFIRAPRQHDQPGKGSYWTLDQRHLNKLDKRKIKRKFNLIPTLSNNALEQPQQQQQLNINTSEILTSLNNIQENIIENNHTSGAQLEQSI